jgi:PDZ domain-containing protein
VQSLRIYYSRRRTWVRRLLLLIFSLLTISGVLWFTPTAYYVTAPGAAIDTSRLVAVPGGATHSDNLYMLIVATQPANLFWYLYAKVDHRADLETRTQFLGTGIADYQKYLEMTRRMMSDSQQTAKALALQHLGYGRGVRTDGAEVSDLVKDGPAASVLQRGDVITELNGKPVGKREELVTLTQGLPGGAPVALRLRRGGKELALTVPTAAHPDPARKGSAYFGILLRDSLTFDIPIPVEIKTGSISGPSAGLMFTLQIIDQLSPQPLAPHIRVAGTGTIEPDGSVGAIGGVQQKVYSAEAAGARVMFVPRANYADAAKVATRIAVVPVDTYKDAVAWLKANHA